MLRGGRRANPVSALTERDGGWDGDWMDWSRAWFSVRIVKGGAGGETVAGMNGVSMLQDFSASYGFLLGENGKTQSFD